MLRNHGRKRTRPAHKNASGRGSVTRALLLVAVLAAWLAVAAFGGMAQGTLSEVQENDQAAFLPESAESTRADELAREFTADQPLPALVVATAADGGEVTPEQFAAAERFAAAIPELELPDGRTVADVLDGPVPVIPAEDGEAFLFPVSIDSALAEENLGDTGERVVNVVVSEVRALAADTLLDADLDAWVTGPAGFIADLVSAFGGIDGVLLLVALVVVLVILFVVYRSPSLPFTVLLTSVFALCAAALVVKPLAGNGVLLLNGQSQGILSILVIGAATDYSLLIVARYREELTRNALPREAMTAAWKASVPPIVASAGTVIAGLLCLLLSDLGSNASLGPVGAIGIAASVLAALTLLPALLLIGGRRARWIFWPRMPEYRPESAPTSDDTSRLWGRIARAVARRPRFVWGTTAVALLALAAFLPTLQAEGTGEADVFLNETEAVAGQDVLVEHFDAGQVEPVVVITAEDTAEEAVAAVTAVDGVEGAQVVADDAGAPVVVDGRVQVNAVTSATSESQEATITAADVRTAVRDVDPDAVVGGAAAQRLDTQETAEQDLRTIIPLVLAVIFVMLVILLRSIVAPLVILAVNVLSFAATLGLSAIFFNHVFGFPGADASVPLFGFVFLVALSIDYSIFLMTRVREEALEHGTRTGVRRGLAMTGGVITSAGLVLAATFGALVVIPLLFLVQLAFIVAVGVLIDTFIVRSLLVSGLVYDIGRPVWWPWQARVPEDGSDDDVTGARQPAAVGSGA
ncbi:MMPL family transporter [Georgenia sp. H159]|uniref:MMPL family transporter n=1 Tax=Georgenia sp. H159 TaxID=3076115 RepID=UPI002D785263|nr:MMPL family transporter [Georgenia sp. H159]